MRKYFTLILLTLGLCAPAFALTLNEARTEGRVGETLSGYIAPRSQDRETLALVEQINKARTESYQRLADSNNLRSMRWRKWRGANWLPAPAPASMFRALTADGYRSD